MRQGGAPHCRPLSGTPASPSEYLWLIDPLLDAGFPLSPFTAVPPKFQPRTTAAGHGLPATFTRPLRLSAR
jgi:hypothetical protein